jgi:hypothetical protein
VLCSAEEISKAGKAAPFFLFFLFFFCLGWGFRRTFNDGSSFGCC